MKLKSIVKCISVAALLLVASCAKKSVKIYYPVKVDHYVIEADLDQAADSVAASLKQLSAVKQAEHNKQTNYPFSSLQAPELERYVYVKWYGPPEPVLRKISSLIGYKLQVYGKRPNLPVLVNVDSVSKAVMARVILQNISLQLDGNAELLLFPKLQVISLRYFKL
ncbi:MAG: hypothetical protein COB50_00270 [Thiotrichales bacterium]|nr:MAG: hypothetical protein COB50_00270 [Thiotrichales bacterium]